jgi:hypothetical protein
LSVLVFAGATVELGEEHAQALKLLIDAGMFEVFSEKIEAPEEAPKEEEEESKVALAVKKSRK